MASRPQFADYRTASHDTLRSGAPSPRIEHFDGEIPPALSPLDAFAAQGRLLARQLEESAQGERRMSRLPPASVARSLSQPRPGYFRAPSSGDSYHAQGGRGGGGLARRPTQRNNPEIEEPKFRPNSEHPRISAISYLASEDDDQHDDEMATPTNNSTPLPAAASLFEFPRTESPEQDAVLNSAAETGPRFYAASPPSPVPSFGVAIAAPSRNSSTDSASRLNVPRGLAPPSSPLSRPSTGSRAAQLESSDDDYSSSNAGSTFSHPRKSSASSAMSLPYSPMSSHPRSHPRSPSLSSETSNTSYLPRPSFNFSRPLSRFSTSLSAPVLMGVSESTHAGHSHTMNRGHKPAPITVPPRLDLADYSHEEPSSALSYIYTKYSLPRGRKVCRDSVVFSGLHTPNFEWTEPLFENSPPADTEATARFIRTPSPPGSRPASVYSESVHAQQARSMDDPPVTAKAPILVPESPPPSETHPPTPESEPIEPSSEAEQQAPDVPAPEPAVSPNDDKEDTTSSADSASTIRPQITRAATTSGVLTADDHVAKGIACHEKGSLNESTYHLRIAAKQNHATGMLLYALACRHGWGMRPNQREGVQWLRRAVDCVGLELMGDSSNATTMHARELQKTYRAQFALSIYELGVSHLNGWGIEQDKSLALRCFEIAGQWGDADALAEAGFCYVEGIGCKKDMKKAAKFYRQAEAKGISMVGNSWIYKEKYKSDGDESTSQSRGRGRHGGTPEKPPTHTKSRARSLFHRKKSLAAEA